MNPTVALVAVGVLLYVIAKQRSGAYTYRGVIGTSPQGFAISGPGFNLSTLGNAFRFGFGSQTQPQVPSFAVPAQSLGPAPDSVDNPPNMPLAIPDTENLPSDPGVFSDPSGLLPDVMVGTPVMNPDLFDTTGGNGGTGLPTDPNAVFGA